MSNLRFGIATILLLSLSACSHSPDDSKEKPEDPINTFNFYMESDGTISDFDPETRKSTVFAQWDPSLPSLYLDTNISKQGYEYIAFFRNNRLYVLDYDRDNDGRTTAIASFSGEICDLFRQKEASRRSFSNNTKNRILTDRHALVVAIKDSAVDDCSPTSDLYYEVSFEFEDDGSADIDIRLVNSSKVLGDILIDYDFVDSEQNSGVNSTRGRSGFLGYDRDGEQLVLRDDNLDVLWEVALEDVESIQQVTNDLVVIETGTEIFVHTISELFSIADQDENQDVPPESRLDALFESPNETVEDDLVPGYEFHNFVGNENSFIIEYTSKLDLWKDASATEVFEKDNDSFDISYGLTDDDRLVVLKIFDDTITLVRVNPDSAISTTLIEADSIDGITLGNDLYFNTLNANGNGGLDAHWVNADGVMRSYENSLFVFANDTRSQKTRILILGSDADTADQYPLTDASLYAFDPNELNGRLQYTDKNNRSRDFNFGEVLGDIYGIYSASIINDEYATIILESEREQSAGSGIYETWWDFYYVDPIDLIDASIVDSNEEDVDNNSNERNSLKMMASQER